MRPFAVALTVAVLLCVTPGLDRADAATPFNVGAVNDSGGLVVFVAVDKGFFAKHGIDGKVIVRNSGPEVTRALDAGEIDFGSANVSSIPVALERGLNVRAVVGYAGGSYTKSTDDNTLGIIARADSGISTVADLRGKRVGTTFGWMNDTYLVELIRKQGLGEAPVKRINTTPNGMITLFDTGRLDAAAVWEPDLTRILEKVKGSRLLVRGGDVVCFCAAMHARPEVLYRDRDATQRYVDAMAEAARFVRDPKNLDEISVIASRHVSGTETALIKRTLKYWVYDMRLGKNSMKAFDDAVRVLIAQKQMSQPFDPAKYYDTSFIERTMKEHPEWFDDLPQ